MSKTNIIAVHQEDKGHVSRNQSDSLTAQQVILFVDVCFALHLMTL